MAPFEDFLFDGRKKNETYQKTLETLLELNPPPTGPTIQEVFSSAPYLVGKIPSLLDPDFEKIVKARQIQLILCNRLLAEPQEARKCIADCPKPILVKLNSLEPTELLASRLLGIYGGIIDITNHDTAAVQLCIETGRSYNFKVFVRCDSEHDAKKTQQIDCNVIWASPHLNKNVLLHIPNTRLLIKELNALEDMDELVDLPHRIGIELTKQLTDFS